MEILVNGAVHVVEAESTLEQLIRSFDIHDKRFAVELNKEFIPKTLFPETTLKAGDRIELLEAIGGG